MAAPSDPEKSKAAAPTPTESGKISSVSPNPTQRSSRPLSSTWNKNEMTAMYPLKSPKNAMSSVSSPK